MVKNKRISLLWEPKSIFMLILREKLYVLAPSMAALSRGCKPRLSLLWSHLKLCQTFGKSKFANFAKFFIFVKSPFVKMPLFVISFEYLAKLLMSFSDTRHFCPNFPFSHKICHFLIITNCQDFPLCHLI